ncbi:hypothetical protein D3C79_911370 [compost metagenome]
MVPPDISARIMKRVRVRCCRRAGVSNTPKPMFCSVFMTVALLLLEWQRALRQANPNRRRGVSHMTLRRSCASGIRRSASFSKGP